MLFDGVFSCNHVASNVVARLHETPAHRGRRGSRVTTASAESQGGHRACASPAGTRGLIVLDVFAAHRCDESVQRLKSLNYDIAFIPGGCTSKLQVHDVYVNKSFKSEMTKWHADLRAKQGSADPVSRGAIGMQVGILNDEPSIRALLLRGMKKLIIEPMNKVDEDTNLLEKLQEDLKI